MSTVSLPSSFSPPEIVLKLRQAPSDSDLMQDAESGEIATTPRLVKDVLKSDRIVLNGEVVQITGKRYVAGKDVPPKFREHGAPFGYIFSTEHENGDLFVLPSGYLEVVNV